MIVIHPGSRFTRVGRACDVNPVTVPSVVARKLRDGETVPKPAHVKGIERPQPGTERTKPIQGTGGGDEYSVSSQSNDPVSSCFLCSFHLHHLLSLDVNWDGERVWSIRPIRGGL